MTASKTWSILAAILILGSLVFATAHWRRSTFFQSGSGSSIPVDQMYLKVLTMKPEQFTMLTTQERREYLLQLSKEIQSRQKFIVNDPLPSNSVLTPISRGILKGKDQFTSSSGSVSIFSTNASTSFLRLEHFSVPPYPKLELYLVNDSSGDVGDGFISLGTLRGEQGSLIVEIPSDIDIHAYHSVVIRLVPFATTIAKAVLE